MKKRHPAEKILFSASGNIYSLAGLGRLMAVLKENNRKCVDDPALECKVPKTAGEYPENEHKISGDRPE